MLIIPIRQNSDNPAEKQRDETGFRQRYVSVGSGM